MSESFLDSGLGQSGLGVSEGDGDGWDDNDYDKDEELLNETEFAEMVHDANEKFTRQLQRYIDYHLSVMRDEKHVYPSAYRQNKSTFQKQARRYQYDEEKGLLFYMKKGRDGIGKSFTMCFVLSFDGVICSEETFHL